MSNDITFKNSEAKLKSRKSHQIHLENSLTLFKVIEVVSQILEDIINETDAAEAADSNALIANSSLFNSFTTSKPSMISIIDYYKRIVKYSQIEPSTLIISLIYIDKLCEEINFELTKCNIHRLILASVLISIKYNEDDYYENDYYSHVGGLSLEELNKMEYILLICLKFNTFIDEALYLKYQSHILDD